MLAISTAVMERWSSSMPPSTAPSRIDAWTAATIRLPAASGASSARIYWEAAQGGTCLVREPATGQQLGEIGLADERDVERAARLAALESSYRAQHRLVYALGHVHHAQRGLGSQLRHSPQVRRFEMTA